MEHLDVSFENLAKMLFQDFQIEKDGVRYDFLEVKFYFFKIDDIEEAGKCFFHMNGLYISFGSKFVYWGKGKFIAYSGRIWIRSILKKEKEKEAKVITGSHKCADELLGGFYAVSEEYQHNFPMLHVHDHENIKIESCVHRLPFCNKKSDAIKEKREIQNPVDLYEYKNKIWEECILRRYHYYRPNYVKLPGNNR